MILLNLMENSDAPDWTELNELRFRLSQLEQRIEATMREINSPSMRMTKADRPRDGDDPQAVAPDA